jgi:hypothetical protein
MLKKDYWLGPITQALVGAVLVIAPAAVASRYLA